MVMKLIKTLLLLTLIFIGSVSICYSLETDIHEDLNEYIARNTLNGFSINDYLINTLGIENGVDESYNAHQIWWWIRNGGLFEDIPIWYMLYRRSVNHFHNPITDQGFSGIWGTGILSGLSSIQWSQHQLTIQDPGGFYSWHDVREYYYLALTDNNKTLRDTNYADMFRGLGQLMHLVQDLSVPEHARDDGHYRPAYEAWMKKSDNVSGLRNVHVSSDNGEINIDGAILTPSSMIYFDSAVIGEPNPLAAVPVANLFDTNQYNGTNPDITLQADVGLSEYTNANFLSSDTMLNGTFAYPSLAGTSEFEENSRTYLAKLGMSGGGNGDSVNHIAATKWTYKYLPSNLKHLGLKLDKKVYKDYALKLVPRAVGYSAELLNYFFRGNIDLVDDTATGSGYVIVNNTEEDMDGTFEIYYDNVNDERNLLWSASFTLDTLSSGNNISSNVSFTAPSDAKLAGSYILVFRGRLGNESDTVIGKVVEQHNLAIFIRQGGVIKRCLTTYKDLMNDVPCTLEIANNIFGGPIINNTDYHNNRITQKAFKHNGRKIYLMNIAQEGTYLYDPINKQFFFLHDQPIFFNASDQNIFVVEYNSSGDTHVFDYTGSGLIQTGTYPSVPSSNYSSMIYVSQNGDSYMYDSQETVVGSSCSGGYGSCITYRKYHTYNIFSGAITELGYRDFREETSQGGGYPIKNYYDTYDSYYLLMTHKSTPHGIDIKFESYDYSFDNHRTNYQDGSGTSTTNYYHTIAGDSYHTIVNLSSVPPNNSICLWSGDKIRVVSHVMFTQISSGWGLLVPNSSDVPYSRYSLYIAADAVYDTSCHNVDIIETVSNLKTPFETFESDTEEYSEQNRTQFLAEDIIGRNFSFSGFVMQHHINNTLIYDELVLYNHHGERIDQHVLNILGISDPTILKGIFLID